jgi:hypothetical protein
MLNMLCKMPSGILGQHRGDLSEGIFVVYRRYPASASVAASSAVLKVRCALETP